MIIKCTNCNTEFNLNEKPLLGRKIALPCPKCKAHIHIDLTNAVPQKKEVVQNRQESETKEDDKERKFEQELDKLFDDINELPTLPYVIQRILSLVSDPDSTIKQIGSLITSDQSLTAKTLKLVNSAYYGFEKKIKTVDQAIIIIGFDAVKNLALSASVFDIFRGIKQKSNFQREAFWLHSIATAMTAKLISEDTGIGIPGELFVAGLLHDIGKIVLDAYFPEQINKVLYYCSSNNISFYEAESMIIKIDHTNIGFRLGKKWNLPDELVYPIRFHHSPNKSVKLEENIAIISLANAITKFSKIGYDGDHVAPKISVHAFNVVKKFKKDFNKTDIQKYIELIKENMANNELIQIAME